MYHDELRQLLSYRLIVKLNILLPSTMVTMCVAHDAVSARAEARVLAQASRAYFNTSIDARTNRRRLKGGLCDE